jgi:hypothetical protein
LAPKTHEMAYISKKTNLMKPVRPKYFAQASNLIFLSVAVGVINTYRHFGDFFSGSMNGGALIVVIVFLAVCLSFMITIACAGLMRAGSGAALPLFFLNFICSIAAFTTVAVNGSLEFEFYILKASQIVLQVWAVWLVIRGQSKDGTVKLPKW